jgi:hypothetical protein
VQTTELRFALRGVPGTVTVRHGVNEDPRRWGYHVLDLPDLVERSRGFPVVEAAIEHPAEGYAAAMGWIQVVRYRETTPLAPAGPDRWVAIRPALEAACPPWTFR